MGKQTKRKQTLQVKETKKTRAATSASSSFVNTFDCVSTLPGSPAAAPSENKEGANMDPKLANFLEGMNTLDSEDQKNNIPAAAAEVPISNGIIDEPPAAKPVESQPPATGSVTFWQAVVDSKTNHTYYWNTETNEVAWTLPPGGVIANPEVGGAGGGAEAEVEKDKDGGGGAGAEEDDGETIDELMENYPYSKKTVVLPPKDESEENVKSEETAKASGEEKAPEETPKAGGVKRKSSPEEESSPSVRNLPPEAGSTSQQPAKKPRMSGRSPESSEDTPTRKKTPVTPSSGSVSRQAEQMMRFKVSNMADQFSRKLEYLHVSIQSLTSLEILSIQLQTRLADWKEGGLPTKYILAKLKQMNEELSAEESIAAPEGWEYVWDSLLSLI